MDLAQDSDCRAQIAELGELFSVLGDNAPLVLTHETSDVFSPVLLRGADVLITMKEEASSLCVYYAVGAGVQILYGRDWAGGLFPHDKKYDVSVCVVTYHPDYDELFRTLLTSIIRQKGCSLEIVISDDGTPDFILGAAYISERRLITAYLRRMLGTIIYTDEAKSATK